jgi:hypothetical protein
LPGSLVGFSSSLKTGVREIHAVSNHASTNHPNNAAKQHVQLIKKQLESNKKLPRKGKNPVKNISPNHFDIESCYSRAKKAPCANTGPFSQMHREPG